MSTPRPVEAKRQRAKAAQLELFPGRRFGCPHTRGRTTCDLCLPLVRTVEEARALRKAAKRDAMAGESG